MPQDNRNHTIELSRRKILGTTGAIGAAGLAAGLGSSAFFSDDETFVNNRLVAGELDLKVDWQQAYNGEPVNAFPDRDGDGVQDTIKTRQELADEAGLPVDSPTVESMFRDQFADVPDDLSRPLIHLEDVKPGDSGEVTFSLHLFDNPGFIDMFGDLRGSAENGFTEPELSDPDEDGGDFSELLEATRATVWYDENGDNELDLGDSTTVRRRCGEAKLSVLDFPDAEGSAPTVKSVNLGLGSDVEPWGVELTADASVAYTTDMHKDSVIEVDAAVDQPTVVEELHTGVAPRDAVVANGKLYVANTGTHPISDQGFAYDYRHPAGPGSVSIYDLTTGEISEVILFLHADAADVDPGTDTVEVDRSSGPRLLRTTDDGSSVFVALGGANRLAVLDTATDAVEGTVDTGGRDPRAVVPLDDRVLVTNFGSGTVGVIDPDGPALTNVIDVDQNPWSIDATDDVIAVTHWSGAAGENLGSVWIIDADADLDTLDPDALDPSDIGDNDDCDLDTHVLCKLTVESTDDGGPWGVASCPNKPIYITNDGSDKTLCINPTKGGVEIEEVDSGELPWDADCGPRTPDSIDDDVDHRVAVPYGGADIRFKERSKQKSVNGDVVEWTQTLTGRPDIDTVPVFDDATAVDVLDDIERVIASGSLWKVIRELRTRDGIPLDGDRTDVARDPYPASTTQHIGFEWSLPVDHANEVQSDSVTFDLGFATEQARHNTPLGASTDEPGALPPEPVAGSNGADAASSSHDLLPVEVTETTGPRLVTAAPDGSRVFAALAGSGELLVLDTATDTVETRISTGGVDPRDIAVVDDDTLLVTNFGSGTVAKIDLPSESVTQLGVGENPWGIDTDGAVAVVANWSGSDGALGSLSVIDTTTDPFDVTTHALPATDDGGPWGVATCPNRPVYITNDGTDSTLKIEFTGGDIDVEAVDEGELPWDAGCSPDGEKVAVAYGGADIRLRETGKTLRQGGTAIECADVTQGPIEWTVERTGTARIADVPADDGGRDVPGIPIDGGVLHRERFGATDLAILDSETGDVLQKVNLGIGDDLEPWGISWSEDSTRVYVTDMHKDSVIEVDAETGRIHDELHTGVAPRDAVVANGKLYVANTGDHGISEKGTPYDYAGADGPGQISIYDLETREILKLVMVLADDV